MVYDKRILNRVMADTENARVRAEERAAKMREKVYAELPRVAEIEAELRSTALGIIRTSFGSGENAAELIKKERDKNLALQAERAELLVGHGYGIDCTEIKTECPVCEDRGFAGGEVCRCVDKKYRREATRELCPILAGEVKGFGEFDLRLYSDRSDEKIKISPRARMSDIFDFCENYAKDFENAEESLFMSGGSGLGKTHLALATAKKVWESGFFVMYDDAFSVLNAYESEKFGRDGEEGARVAQYESCDLLVIDDLGCEMATAFTLAALYNLINRRIMTKKKTIVISSLSTKDILKKYGEQMYSRLTGEFVMLSFCGEDVRKKRKK